MWWGSWRERSGAMATAKTKKPTAATKKAPTTAKKTTPRKEKTKEQRIKSEKTRLRGIFKELDENKRKLVTPLIEKAAFMSVELDDLQAKLQAEGWTSEYQNGQNQWGTKKSPEAETYIALSKNYAAIVKQLTELVPAAKRKNSKLAALRAE